MGDLMRLRGDYEVRCYGPDGKLDWADVVRNTIVVVGLSNVLRAGLVGGTPVTEWFMGLIANSGFDEITVDDTMSSHAGWTEFTDYGSATRPQWAPLSESNAVVLNTSPVQFTFGSAGTVKGFFLTSSSAKSGTAGTLFSAAPLSTARTVRAGANLTITYTVRAAGGT